MFQCNIGKAQSVTSIVGSKSLRAKAKGLFVFIAQGFCVAVIGAILLLKAAEASSGPGFDMSGWPDILPLILRHTSFTRSDHEPDYFYLTYTEAGGERFCLKFRYDEMAEVLSGLKPGKRYGALPLLLSHPRTGEGHPLDSEYCYAETPPHVIWVVSDNYWANDRPMYEWVDERRGKMIGRIKEGVECEKEPLMQSTREREWRYATNGGGVRGAVLCQRAPEAQVDEQTPVT